MVQPDYVVLRSHQSTWQKMKSQFNNIRQSFVTLCALLLGMAQGYTDVTVKVDSTQQWVGYMNVWETNGTTYAFGGAWATVDLRAAFIPTNSPIGWPVNGALVLRPNTNTYAPGSGNPPDTNYWDYSDGTPNKVLEANFYRDVGTNLAGQTVTFTGKLLSNNIPAIVGGNPATGWQVLAFVKDFTPGYGTLTWSSVPLSAPGPFSVSQAIMAGHICQWGFIVKGPNTAPGSANSLTSAGILVEDSDPAITNQPVSLTLTSGTTTNLSVGAVGSGPLAYQWKTNGVSLINSAKYSGVDTKTLTITNAQSSDGGAYVVTVSNVTTSATVDSTPAQLTVLDVLITTNPVSQRVEQGSTVVFSVAATSSSSLSYLWKRVINGVTNIAVGGNMSGTLTSTLTLTNVQPSDSGFYFVTITPSGKPGLTTGATLLVKTYADYPNFLENPGFENDPAGVNESPWHRFEVTDPGSFGKLQSSSDTYYNGGNVNVYAGTYVSFTSYNGVYSGIYQDVTAAPGQIFTADMWFYNANGDPIPGPSSSPLPATNENYLEVQFRAGDNPTPIRQYITSITNLAYTTPRDVWFQLQATNAGTYGYDPATENAKYLVAPPGTTTVRFQLTMHDIANSVGDGGSIYYDSARLMLKLPVTVSAAQVGSDIVLSWKSLGSTYYQVQYKDTIDGPWQNLGAQVPGTGLVITKSDPISAKRFYRVLTL